MNDFMNFFKEIAIEKLALLLFFILSVIGIFRTTLKKILPVFIFKFFKIAPHKKALETERKLNENKAKYIDAVERVIFEIPISRKTVLEFNQNVVVSNPDNFLKQLNIIADYHRRTGMGMTYGLVDICDHNQVFENVFFDHIKGQIEKNNILIKIIFPNTVKFQELHMLLEQHIKRTNAKSVKLVTDGYRRMTDITPIEKRAFKYGNE